MKSSEQILKARETYLRRYRRPHQAIRRAYAELDLVLGSLVPRHFAHEGTVRQWALSCPEPTLTAELAERVVYTLDSALLHLGLRGWGPGHDLWLYVSHWSDLEAAESRGLLKPAEGPAAEGRALVHACLLELPLSFQRTGDNVRVVENSRLLEDLLGSHGLRYDLFARLLAEFEAGRPVKG